MKNTTIVVTPEVVQKIRSIGKMGQSYNDVVESVLDFYQKNGGGICHGTDDSTTHIREADTS